MLEIFGRALVGLSGLHLVDGEVDVVTLNDDTVGFETEFLLFEAAAAEITGKATLTVYNFITGVLVGIGVAMENVTDGASGARMTESARDLRISRDLTMRDGGEEI